MSRFKILMFLVPFICTTGLANVHVEGYYKKDGTYVAPYYRSEPNSTTQDNWSTKGNVNPYTGEKGYKNTQEKNSLPDTTSHQNWNENYPNENY